MNCYSFKFRKNSHCIHCFCPSFWMNEITGVFIVRNYMKPVSFFLDFHACFITMDNRKEDFEFIFE